MRIFAAIVVACGCTAMLDVHAAQPSSAATASSSSGISSSFSRETGVVEDVIGLDQEGYRFRTYVVGWHGSRVLVTDPLAQSSLAQGDSLHFLAIRLDLNGRHILGFVSDEHTANAPRSERPSAPAPIRDTSFVATGTVEDVLQAQDGDYPFTGYIVRYQDQRIALIDRTAGPAHAIGDQLRFLSIRTAAAQRRLIAFEMYAGASSEAKTQATPNDRAVSESGIVTQVLSGELGGYGYRAYVVQRNGASLLLPDQNAGTDYHVGDTVSFTAHHLQIPMAGGQRGLVRYELPTSTSVSAAPTSDAVTQSLATDHVSATVEQVLTGVNDGDAYNAYIVNWNGLRVGLADEFATTHFAVGQRISLPVSRIDANGSKLLSFMLFNFPAPATSSSRTSE